MSNKVRRYSSDEIDVTWDAKRCIHAAECVRGLPIVFDTSQRPWIQPANADADELAGIVLKCPTGALHFERKDGGGSEAIPELNRIAVAADGPLYLSGEIQISDMGGNVLLEDTRVALCRCGASENKPFCDNSHTEAGFADDGLLASSGGSTVGNGRLSIKTAPNGPLLLQGDFKIQAANGTFADNKGALCRCGGSSNKPFCDGTHSKIGFIAD